MIPNIDILSQEIQDIIYHGRTYKIVLRSEAKKGINVLSLSTLNDIIDAEVEMDRISGYTDDIDAVMQAIYLILNTERYKFVIYSWDYGVELVDLFGKPIPYVMSELPRRIKDALIQDNRITDVTDFEFEHSKHKLHTTFAVVTDLGNISVEMEVDV